MKFVRALLASAAVFLTSAGASAQPVEAQVDTVDPTTPTQLPRTAIPHHYAITITPHAERLAFDARVRIGLDVIKPTRQLVLNAADLAFASVTLRPARGSPAMRASVAIDERTQTAAFTFPATIAPGAYQLDISYAGKINTQANGLFALDYKNSEGQSARSLFTQFEAADARRFIPSWDEPDYKARFDLTAIVPAQSMAVGNMPVMATRPLGAGLKEVRFQTTPTMSSYLLFFADGDFDRITKPVGNREVGVVMSKGNGAKGQLALDSEAQILPYYDAYFGVPYPLPKLDNVAGPGQSQFFGAMENWGAIFTFERILLNDPAITSEAERQDIFGVEAHEMAHQWFGDLVTMDWWGDIWLNEGFASWMANKATQHFHPEWGADVDHVAAREGAMQQDSFKSTHPIVQDVRTVEQANQAFDAITYSKGESVLSMLEGFAGAEVWQRGIQSYIRTHAYQNAKTEDLWKAMENVGAKGLGSIARDFTNQPGVPLIEVGATRCEAGRTMVTLAQRQFSFDEQAQVTAHPRAWHVPVRATAGNGQVEVVTTGPANEISVPGCGPLLLNVGQTGYYRTLYKPQEAEALVQRFSFLGPVDQFGLMNDQLALSTASYQPMAVGLSFLDAVATTSNAKLVQSALGQWSSLYDDLDGDPQAQAAIAARVIERFGPRLRELGFAPKADDSAVDALLRSSLIGTLGKFRDPAVLAESRRLFEAWQRNPNAIPGSLKQTWLGVLARNAAEEQWNILRAKARSTASSVERTSLYELLGAASDESLARRALDLALTGEPGKTDSAGIITTVAQRHPRMAIDFALEHLAQVNQLIDISGRSRFMQRLAASSRDPGLIPVLENYANANLAASDRKPIDEAIDRLRFRGSAQPRIVRETAQWLKAHPQG